MKTKTVEIKVFECKRCGYEWLPRLDKKPKACPSCKSYKWDEEKRD